MNWSFYNDALRQRGSLLIWHHEDMMWLAPKAGRNARPPVFSGEADHQEIRGTVCLTAAFQLA